MTLCEDIARYGAKGAALNYIRESDASIPIEPYVLVGVGEDWRNQEGNIRDLGPSLVRSSSPVEDGERRSFAGLFATTEFAGEGSVAQVRESARNEDALTYAKNHGMRVPEEMGLVFQRLSGARWNWGMLRHPHRSEIVFIQGRPVSDSSRYSENLVFDERTGDLQDVHQWARQEIYGNAARLEDMPFEMRAALDAYRKIERFPGFRTGHTYHMEFGTHPFSVYQFRPFRKQENAAWELDPDKIERKDSGIPSRYALAFGITPPEGIELTLVRAIDRDVHDALVERYRKLVERGRPEDAIIRSLIRSKNLRKIEHPYAEEVVKIPPHSYGYAETQALERAIERMNDAAEKERTCLLQQNMHFYHGRDIDLIFPNASAWIGHMGFEFLSHSWFRAAQSYDVVLIGDNVYSKSGEKMRIYSDGIRGIVTKSKNSRR